MNKDHLTEIAASWHHNTLTERMSLLDDSYLYDISGHSLY